MSGPRTFLISVCLWALGSYLMLGWWYGSDLFGLAYHFARFWAFSAMGLLAVSLLVIRIGQARFGESLLTNLGVIGAAILLCLVVVDTGYSVYEQVRVIKSGKHSPLRSRRTDSHLFLDEYLPRIYYPTGLNFHLHKPGYRASGRCYGYFYDSPELLKSQTVREKVLELTEISFAIDERGFRETIPLETAEIVTLGDSFTFGSSVDQDQNWPKVLERLTGRPVYNLGTFSSSPAQQVMLIQHLLGQPENVCRPRRLVWMIFEGNDLEDSFSPLRPRELSAALSPGRIIQSTVLETILSVLPARLGEGSLIHRLKTGKLRFRWDEPGADGGMWEVDGVRLSRPLYSSKKHGMRVFLPEFIDRAKQGPGYVLSHPNRSALEQCLRVMADLSRAKGCRVSVVLMPTAARLYGKYFDGFPKISESPHFLDFVAEKSKELGFQVINLAEELAGPAAEKLLFRRDDSHLNEAGNQVVAELLAKRLGK